MRAVKGKIRDGVVSLLEPVDVPGEREVTVLVPDDDGEKIPAGLQYAGMLSDLTAAEKAVFHETIERPIVIR